MRPDIPQTWCDLSLACASASVTPDQRYDFDMAVVHNDSHESVAHSLVQVLHSAAYHAGALYKLRPTAARGFRRQRFSAFLFQAFRGNCCVKEKHRHNCTKIQVKTEAFVRRCVIDRSNFSAWTVSTPSTILTRSKSQALYDSR